MQQHSDPFNLQRFVDAQTGTFHQARTELLAGHKTSHWMWFIFPQIAGLGSSPLARKFAIASIEEAAAYLDHPILGPRLRECSSIVTGIESRSIHQIFGSPDDLKFHSSMTLFLQATPDNQVFRDALQKYFAGALDSATIYRLEERLKLGSRA